uniref:Coiled-coil domain-containing protein 158 isoform X4 n=1 Tax=Geotrypetes seraphini TaxID=260995 RepID=A0A6P8NLG4_GEOSA|nr:coiled-coil domain-containing protein 158 isoform X4 [Geotrypetes seraphini]
MQTVSPKVRRVEGLRGRTGKETVSPKVLEVEGLRGRTGKGKEVQPGALFPVHENRQKQRPLAHRETAGGVRKFSTHVSLACFFSQRCFSKDVTIKMENKHLQDFRKEREKQTKEIHNPQDNVKVSMDRLTFSMQDRLDDDSSDDLSISSVGATNAMLDNRCLIASSPHHSSMLKSTTFTVHSRSPSNDLTYDNSRRNKFSEEHLKKLLEECSEQVKDLQRRLNESSELQDQQKYQFKQSIHNLQTQNQKLELDRDSLVESRKKELRQEEELRKELRDTIGDLKETNMLHEEIVKQSNVQIEQLKEMVDEYDIVLQEIRTALIGFETSKGKKVCEREPISKLQVNSLGSAVTKVLSELDTELSFLKGKLFLVEGQYESLRMESQHKFDFAVKQHEDRYDELFNKYEQEVGMLTDKRNRAHDYAMSIQIEMESIQERASIQNSLYLRQLTELETTVTQLHSELREAKKMRTEKADLQKYDELLRMEKEQNKKLCERDSGNSLTIAQLQQDLDEKNIDIHRLEAQIKAMKDGSRKHTEQQEAEDVEKKEALEKAAYFNSQLDSTKKKLCKITDELTVTKRDLEKAEQTIVDLTFSMGEKRTIEAGKETATIISKNKSLTAQLDSTKDMLSKTTNEVIERKKDLDNAEKTIADLTFRLEEMKTNETDKEVSICAKNACLTTELNSTKDKLSKTTDELTAMKRDLESAKKTIADLTFRLEEIRTSETDKEIQKAVILEKNDALEKVAHLTYQLESTKKMLSKTTDELTIGKKDLETAEKKIADMTSALEEKRICKKTKEKSEILEKNEALEKAASLTTELQTTKDVLCQTRHELKDRTRDLEKAEKNITDLASRIEEMRTCGRDREKSEILEKNEALEKAASLNTELQTTKDVLCQTRHELKDRTRDLEKAEKNITDLTSRIEEMRTCGRDREKSEILEKNEALEKAASLTTELQTTKDVLCQTRHELKDRTIDLDKAEKTIADLTSRIEEMRTCGRDKEKTVLLEKSESLEKLASLTTQLHSTKGMLSKTNDELTFKKKNLEKAEKTIYDLTNLVEEMRTSAADREKTVIHEKHEALQKAARLTAQLNSTKDLLSKTNDELIARKRDLETSKKTINDLNSFMKEKRISEASCVDSTDDDFALLKKDIAQLREACEEADTLKLQLAEKDKKLCSLQKQADDMAQMIERNSKSSCAMQLENTKLVKEVDYRKRELEELKACAICEKNEILEKVKFLTSKLNVTEEMLRRTANELSTKQSVLETTEKTLQEKKKTIESSSSELSVLHSQMNRKSQDFEQLEKELSQLRKASLEAEILKRHLAEKNKEISNLQSQVENMAQIMAQHSQRANAMELEKSNLLKDFSRKEKELQELKMASLHEKTETHEKIALLTSQLELTQEMLHKTNDELGSKKKDMDKAQRAIADLTSSLQEKKKNLDVATVEIKKLYAQIDYKTQDIEQLKKEVEELKNTSAEVESLKLQLTEKDKKIYFFKNQVDSLSQKFEQYTQRVDDVDMEKTNLLRVISSKNEEIKDHKIAKENKAARIHELEEKLSNLEKENTKLMNSNAEELRTTKQITLERDQLKSQMKTLNNELTTLAAEHETLKRNYQYKNEEMERITTKLKLRLKTTSAELEQTKGALKSSDEADEHGMKAAVEMQKLISAKREQIDVLQSKISYLEEMLANETKDKLHLHEEKKKQNEELSFLKTEKNKLVEELEKFKTQELLLKEKICSLDSTLEKVSKKFAEYQATIQRMEQESVRVKLQHTFDVKEIQGPGHISTSTSVQPQSMSKSYSRTQNMNLPPTFSSSKSKVPGVVKTKVKKEDLLNFKPLIQQLKISPTHLTKQSDDGYRKEEASSSSYRSMKDANKQSTSDTTTDKKPSTLRSTDLEEQISRIIFAQSGSSSTSTASSRTPSPAFEDWKARCKSPIPRVIPTADDCNVVPRKVEKLAYSACPRELPIHKGSTSLFGKQEKCLKKIKDQEQMLME